MASRSFIDYLLNPGPDEVELQEAIRSAAGVADDIAAAFVAIDAAVAATAADVVTVNAQVTYVEGLISTFDTDAAAAIAAIAADRAAALADIDTASTTAQGAIDATATSAISTVNTARDDAIAATDAGVATITTAVTDAQAALDATGDAITTDLNIIKADTQNFRDEAETARDEAVAAAAAVDIPVIVSGDAGKVLTVKGDETGTEWLDAGVDLPAGGTTGQFLRKESATEQDADWADLPDASSIQAGIVELATPAETVAGLDQDRAATSEGVKAAIDAAGANDQLTAAIGEAVNLIIKYVTAATVDIDADRIVLRDTDGVALSVANVNLTVDMATSGKNGRGSGLTEANSTWYYLWVSEDGGVPYAWLDTSISGANDPDAISDFKGLVGTVRNDGSGNFLKFIQFNDMVLVGEPISTHRVLSGGTSTSYATVDLSSVVPPNASTVEFMGEFASSSGTNAIFIQVGAAGSGTTATYGKKQVGGSVGAAYSVTALGKVVLSTPQQVAYYMTGTNPLGGLVVVGYEYFRRYL